MSNFPTFQDEVVSTPHESSEAEKIYHERLVEKVHMNCHLLTPLGRKCPFKYGFLGTGRSACYERIPKINNKQLST